MRKRRKRNAFDSRRSRSVVRVKNGYRQKVNVTRSLRHSVPTVLRVWCPTRRIVYNRFRETSDFTVRLRRRSAHVRRSCTLCSLRRRRRKRCMASISQLHAENRMTWYTYSLLPYPRRIIGPEAVRSYERLTEAR